MKLRLIILWGSMIASESLVAQEQISFARQIASIVVDNCVACHGAKKAEGGYRIDTFDYLSKSGDSGVAPIVAAKPMKVNYFGDLSRPMHPNECRDSEPLAPSRSRQ